jgi:putative endonuclease
MPWELLYIEEYSLKTEAMRREREVKSSNGRKFIRSLIK